MGEITAVSHSQNNVILEVRSDLSAQLSIDQSVAHNGVCLTVESLKEDYYTVVAIAETLRKTTIARWEVGQKINLETAMGASTLLDGHIVQGHVDGVCTLLQKEEQGGSVKFTFEYPTEGTGLIVEKGSVTLDGVSLTCFEVSSDQFSVAIIPYTLTHTSVQNWKVDDKVNIEFDILGKIVQKQVALYLNQTKP